MADRSAQSMFQNRLVIGKAVLASGLSQAISSLTNFGILLYLVRRLNKEQFGLYGLGFSLTLLFAGLIGASIAVQLVVNLPDRRQVDRLKYAADHVVAVALLAALGSVAAVVLGVIAERFGLITGNVALLGASVGLATSGYGLRDILARIAYSERREWLVLVSNSTVALGIVVGYALSVVVVPNVSASLALSVYAFGQVAGAVYLFYQLRLPARAVRTADLRRALTDCWSGGRWALLTTLSYNLRAQSYNFVVAPLLGAATLAELHASRVLVTPALMIFPPLNQVLTPRLAEARRTSANILKRAAMVVLIVQVSIAIAYSALLIPLLPLIVPWALGGAYVDANALVVAWCSVVLLIAVRSSLTLALEAMRAFRSISFLNWNIAPIAVALVVVLSLALGPVGAIIAMGISEFLLCWGLSKICKRTIV